MPFFWAAVIELSRANVLKKKGRAGVSAKKDAPLSLLLPFPSQSLMKNRTQVYKT
jgi:hypothetical protein